MAEEGGPPEPWRIDGDDAVLEWISGEGDAELVVFVLDWIGEWAIDPERYVWMPVPNCADQIFVTIVSGSTVCVKFFVSQQLRVVRILEMKTIRDI